MNILETKDVISANLSIHQLFDEYLNHVKTEVTRPMQNVLDQGQKPYQDKVADRYRHSYLHDKHGFQRILDPHFWKIKTVISREVAKKVSSRQSRRVTSEAFTLYKSQGMEEPRSGDWNRRVFSEFILYLAEKDIANIGLIAGDMNKLKTWNTIGTRIADVAILTIFYTGKHISDQQEGIFFVPVEGGGDDSVILTINPTEKSLTAVQDALEAEMAVHAEKVVETMEAGSLYNRPFEFTSTGLESKVLSDKEKAELRRYHAANKLPTLGSTYVHDMYNLDEMRTKLKAGLPRNQAIDDFFRFFHGLHSKIEEKKKAAIPEDFAI